MVQESFRITVKDRKLFRRPGMYFVRLFVRVLFDNYWAGGTLNEVGAEQRPNKAVIIRWLYLGRLFALVRINRKKEEGQRGFYLRRNWCS